MMNTKHKWLAFGLVAFLALICIAGVKVSRMTRTTTFQSNSLFIVVTGTTTKATRHVQAHDLARGLGPWITNAAGGSATNAIGTILSNGVQVATGATSLDFVQGSNTVLRATNTAGAVTVQINAVAGAGAAITTNENQFLGVPLAIKSGAELTNLVLRPATVGDQALTIRAPIGQSGSLGEVYDTNGNLVLVINKEGALVGLGGVSGPRLLTTSTAGYVWTAAGTDGTGAWSPSGGGSFSGLSNSITVSSGGGVLTNAQNYFYLQTNQQPVLSNTFVNLANGSILELGPGTFNVVPGQQDYPLTNVPLILRYKTNVTIRGAAGYNTKIAGNGPGAWLTLFDCENVTIENLYFDGNQSGYSSNGVTTAPGVLCLVGTNNHIRLSNLHFADQWVHCIFLGFQATDRNDHVRIDGVSGSNYGCTNVTGIGPDGSLVAGIAHNLLVTGFDCYRAMRGIEIFNFNTTGVRYTNVVVKGGVIQGVGYDALNAVGDIRNITFSDIAISGELDFFSIAAPHGLKVRAGIADMMVNNITVNNLSGPGFSVECNSVAGISNVIFTGCSVVNCGKANIGGNGFSMTDDAGGPVIDNIQIYNFTIDTIRAGDGIGIFGGRNIRIANGRIRNAGDDGGRSAIKTLAGFDPVFNVAIENVQIVNDAGASSTQYAVDLHSTVTNVVFRGPAPVGMVLGYFNNAAGNRFYAEYDTPDLAGAFRTVTNLDYRITRNLSVAGSVTLPGLATNSIPYIGGGGIVSTAALSGLTLSGGVLTSTGGGGGPSTNPPPQTLTLSGTGSTNIIIDMLALGPTNEVRVTLTTQVAFVFTNVVDGKYVTAETIQDSTGGWTISTNNAYPHNIRIGTTTTGFDVETNATWRNLHRFRGSGTNAQLVGYSLGFTP